MKELIKYIEKKFNSSEIRKNASEINSDSYKYWMGKCVAYQDVLKYINNINNNEQK